MADFFKRRLISKRIMEQAIESQAGKGDMDGASSASESEYQHQLEVCLDSCAKERRLIEWDR